jgi:addiction module HigA family antidote
MSWKTAEAARGSREDLRIRAREASSLGPAVHTGEILLEEFLKPLEMTQAAAAKTLGMSTVRLNELLRGKRGVTADTALRLAQLFRTTPQFWMHTQADFDLKAAMVRRRALTRRVLLLKARRSRP